MKIYTFPLSEDLCSRMLDESSAFRKFVLDTALNSLINIPGNMRFFPKNYIVRAAYQHVQSCTDKISAIKYLRTTYADNREEFHQSEIYADINDTAHTAHGSLFSMGLAQAKKIVETWKTNWN